MVGGPLLFRAPDPDSGLTGREGKVAGWAFILVFKLNRDPFVRLDGDNSNRGRGDYAFGGHDLGDEGVHKSAGKYCFVTYFSGLTVNSNQLDDLKALKIGDLVRVNARPRGAQPKGRLFAFDVPLLKATSQYVDDKASLRELRRIGCGAPKL